MPTLDDAIGRRYGPARHASAGMMMRYGIGMTLATCLLLAPAAAPAQSDVGGRVSKLEAEMRAVQRKVFPGGAGATIQPDIVAPEGTATPLGAPASSPLVDLTQRVSALEGQMATLTGQIEQNQFQIKQLQDSFDAYRRQTDAKLAYVGTSAAAGGATAANADTAADGASPATSTAAAPLRPRKGPPVRPGRQEDAADEAPPTASAATSRTKALTAVEKPSTGDAAEDVYTYGYRLWSAKMYPEAEVQLKKVVTDYPKSKRASYAQNLLGRSYLDDGKPSLASMAFYDNYKKMPDGERAPESLYYLAQALMKLDKPADACKVYGELTDVYGGKIGAGMKADIDRGRAAARCK